MRVHATTRVTRTGSISTTLAAAAAALAAIGMSGIAQAAMPEPEPYDATSDAGVVPDLYTSSQGGGDKKCIDLDPSFTGDAHFEMGEEVMPAAHEDDDHHHEDPPEGLEYSVEGTEVSWSSEFPISAVIVKGGSRSHAYVYAPALWSDSGLTTPLNNGGKPNDISSLRFCWQEDPAEFDLVDFCVAAAANAGAGSIVSAVGPIQIRDGMVDAMTVPDDVLLTYDEMTEMVGFTAPFPVVAVATQASVPTIHPIDPPAMTGSVPLSSNPGDGDVVLCGLAVPIVYEASCEQLPGTTLYGPIAVVGGMVDPDGLPAGIEDVVVAETTVDFAAAVPVAGVVVVASVPQLYTFPDPLLTGSVPVVIDDGMEVELAFCATTFVDDSSGTDDTEGTSTTDDASATGDASTTADAASGATASDPTTIPTGGGPSGRSALLLLAFGVLALTGSASMLLWSRSE